MKFRIRFMNIVTLSLVAVALAFLVCAWAGIGGAPLRQFATGPVIDVLCIWVAFGWGFIFAAHPVK